MKILVFLTAMIFTITVFSTGNAISINSSPIISQDIIKHGGGCRKASPPGQCCHMNNKTGLVHCH